MAGQVGGHPGCDTEAPINPHAASRSAAAAVHAHCALPCDHDPLPTAVHKPSHRCARTVPARAQNSGRHSLVGNALQTRSGLLGAPQSSTGACPAQPCHATTCCGCFRRGGPTWRCWCNRQSSSRTWRREGTGKAGQATTARQAPPPPAPPGLTSQLFPEANGQASLGTRVRHRSPSQDFIKRPGWNDARTTVICSFVTS